MVANCLFQGVQGLGSKSQVHLSGVLQKDRKAGFSTLGAGGPTTPS